MIFGADYVVSEKNLSWRSAQMDHFDHLHSSLCSIIYFEKATSLRQT